MNIDYFIPRYSTADGGATDPVYGGYSDNINWNERSYPLTRAMCRINHSAGSSGYSGTSDTMTIRDPHINISSVTRYSNSSSAGGNTDRDQRYVVILDNVLYSGEVVPMLSCYGRYVPYG